MGQDVSVEGGGGGGAGGGGGGAPTNQVGAFEFLPSTQQDRPSPRPATGSQQYGQSQSLVGAAASWLTGAKQPAPSTDKSRQSIYVQNRAKGSTLRVNVGQEVEAQWDEDSLWYRAIIVHFKDVQNIRVKFSKYGNEQPCGVGQLRPVIEYELNQEVEARFIEDEKWYSATITECVDADTFNVLFTEYGNTQLCDRSIVRPLEKHVKAAISKEIARQSMRYTSEELASALRDDSTGRKPSNPPAVQAKRNDAPLSEESMQRLRMLQALEEDEMREDQIGGEDVFADAGVNDAFSASGHHAAIPSNVRQKVIAEEPPMRSPGMTMRNVNALANVANSTPKMAIGEESMLFDDDTLSEVQARRANTVKGAPPLIKSQTRAEKIREEVEARKKKAEDEIRAKREVERKAKEEVDANAIAKKREQEAAAAAEVAAENKKKAEMAVLAQAASEQLTDDDDLDDEAVAAAFLQAKAKTPLQSRRALDSPLVGASAPIKQQGALKVTPAPKQSALQEEKEARISIPDFSPSELMATMNQEVDEMAKLNALINDRDGFLSVRILLQEARSRLMTVQGAVGQGSSNERLERLKENRRRHREQAASSLKSLALETMSTLERDALYSDEDPDSDVDGDDDDDDDTGTKTRSRGVGTVTMQMEHQRKAMEKLKEAKRQQQSVTESSRPEADTGDSESRKRVATQLASQLMSGVLGGRGALKKVERPEPANAEPTNVETPLLAQVHLKPTGKLRSLSSAPEVDQSINSRSEPVPSSPSVVKKAGALAAPPPITKAGPKAGGKIAALAAGLKFAPGMMGGGGVAGPGGPPKTHSAPLKASDKGESTSGLLEDDATRGQKKKATLRRGGRKAPTRRGAATALPANHEEEADSEEERGETLMEQAPSDDNEEAARENAALELKREMEEEEEAGRKDIELQKKRHEETKYKEEQMRKEEQAQKEEQMRKEEQRRKEEELHRKQEELKRQEEELLRKQREMEKARLEEAERVRLEEEARLEAESRALEQPAASSHPDEPAGGPRVLAWAHSLQEGSECEAEFEEDGVWYFAQVLTVIAESNQWLILFPDYGNTQLCVLDQLRPLDGIYPELVEPTVIPSQVAISPQQHPSVPTTTRPEPIAPDLVPAPAVARSPSPPPSEAPAAAATATVAVATSSSPTPHLVTPLPTPGLPVNPQPPTRESQAPLKKETSLWGSLVTSVASVVTASALLPSSNSSQPPQATNPANPSSVAVTSVAIPAPALGPVNGPTRTTSNPSISNSPVTAIPTNATVPASSSSSASVNSKAPPQQGVTASHATLSLGRVPAAKVTRDKSKSGGSVTTAAKGGSSEKSTRTMTTTIQAPKKKKKKKKVRFTAGSYCEALRGAEWVPAWLSQKLSPGVWRIEWADTWQIQDGVMEDRLKESPSAGVAAVNFMAAAEAVRLQALAKAEQDTFETKREFDALDEKFEEADDALRMRQHVLQQELARVQGELDTLVSHAGVIQTLEQQVTSLKEELEVLALQEEALDADARELELKQRALEKERKKKEEELKRKRREEERLQKEKERARAMEEEKFKRERERQRQREEEEKRKKQAAKAKRAEGLKASLEAGEAERERELEEKRREEEEEERRQEEEEKALFAKQQELLRQEEERKKRRELELQKSREQREALLKESKEKRKQNVVEQEELDSLLDDEAELNELLGQTATSSMALHGTLAGPGSSGADAIGESSRVIRQVKKEELDDSFLEDDEKGLLEFIARRSEAGFVRESSAETGATSATPQVSTATSHPPPSTAPSQDPSSRSKVAPKSPRLPPPKSLSRSTAVAGVGIPPAKKQTPAVGATVTPPPTSSTLPPLQKLVLAEGHGLPDAVVEVHQKMAHVVEAWMAIEDSRVLSEGPVLYEQVKALRDPLKDLHTAHPAAMKDCIAAWRRLNQEMPSRINSVRSSSRPK